MLDVIKRGVIYDIARWVVRVFKRNEDNVRDLSHACAWGHCVTVHADKSVQQLCMRKRVRGRCTVYTFLIGHITSSFPFESDHSSDLPDKIPSSGIGAVCHLRKEQYQHFAFSTLFCVRGSGSVYPPPSCRFCGSGHGFPEVSNLRAPGTEEKR